ncbi:MAG: SulP family inorganic anion transporter [Ornithinimicrobium sp.]|uniref:SulP family inorganic anion transporter n=1 Tax=Ornithinimicrobium sp. TaxID=1977084 RepID=UPI0026E06134|nr:SulP family inorganic anion transporter [Ornithinimicrobium sp.]MDO5739027.1 SulP family inorganic anion transporter [Ornithinimicrobium sp.]
MRTTPVPAWVRSYERPWLRWDVLAGVTVAAYAIPQVMAYATIAGLPPTTGIWGLVGGLLAYSLVGTSRTLSVGPESTTALMTAAAVGAVVTRPQDYAPMAVALCFVVAAFCLLGWIGGLSRVSDLLSRPVMVGYMAGIAGVMIVSQAPKLTGVNVEGEGVLAQTWSLLTHLDAAHVPTLVLSLVLIAVLFLTSWRWPRAPIALVGILAAAAVVAWTPAGDLGIDTVGALPAGLPTPALGNLTIDSVVRLLVPALGVTLVAYSDNILTARAFAEDGEQVDARRELLALSAANLGAGLFQGLPVSSSGSRTAIANAIGAKSQGTAVVTALATALAVLTLRPVLAQIPSAALGAVVVYAAAHLIEVGELRRFARFRKSELVIALSTTAGVLVFGVLEGIIIAVVLSLSDVLRRVSRPHDAVLGFVPGLAGMHDVDDHPTATTVPGLVVYRYDSPLFFANAEDFKNRALRAVRDEEHPVEWFVLNAEANTQVDITAADALEDLRTTLAAEGVVLALARVKDDLRVELAPSGILDRIGEEHIFATLPTAVDAFRQRPQS